MDNPNRQTFHIEPPFGLLNDPNGLVEFKGEYLCFHQWNRFGLDHGYKEWRGLSSPDLIHWKAFGSALLPDRMEDRNGVYSGCAVADGDVLRVFYTGNRMDDGRRTSTQCLAVSKDGRTFLKLPEGIPTPDDFTAHFRDPKVLRGREGWWMLVGGQTKDRRGAVALLGSKDLEDWRYVGILYDDDLDQMCECPDLIRLDGGPDVLICCPQQRGSDMEGNADVCLRSRAVSITGTFDEESGRFSASGPQEPLDHGFDFHAPQTFRDRRGRTILMGWMYGMSPEQERSCPTREFGYLHCLTIPRVLEWTDGCLRQRPVEELESLRLDETVLTAGDGSFEMPAPAFEIALDRSEGDAPFTLELRDGAVTVEFDPNRSSLRLSRTDWASGDRQSRQCRLETLDDFRILVDASTVELFANGGETVLTARYFTTADALRQTYRGLGPSDTLRIHRLESAL